MMLFFRLQSLSFLILTVISLGLTVTSAFHTNPWKIKPQRADYGISTSYQQHQFPFSQRRQQHLVRHRNERVPKFRRQGAVRELYSFPLHGESFFLTRIVFLRGLAFVYGIAFLIAKHQAKALIGDNGIVPARRILDSAEIRGRKTSKQYQDWLQSPLSDRPAVKKPSSSQREDWISWLRFWDKHPFVQRIMMKMRRNAIYQYWKERIWDRQDGMGRPVTTLLWLAKDRSKLNRWLDGIAIGGLILSIIVFVLGAANVPILFGLWICQRSLMAVGGPFWGYGWEVQLAELGFHALFLVPLFSLDPICISSPPSEFVLYSIRWHLFRVMLGAGLIKLRSDDMKWKWPNFSAMDYFYETQPVPNPITRYMHWMPKWWHRFEVIVNHVVELIAPWMLIIPMGASSWRRVGGFLQIIFQTVLISSGNLSFLNWLTIVPAITCLDDSVLGNLFSSKWKDLALEAAYYGRQSGLRNTVSILFVIWIGYLSLPVIKNLASKHQVMNASFGPWRLINTYGAFGVVDETRSEFIVSASSSYEGPWKEYEFKVKRGNVMRSPRFISPYHYRLDWQFWIASSVPNLSYSSWMYSFLLKLLERNPEVLRLLHNDPFQDDPDPPKYIRVDKYRYEFNRDTKEGPRKNAYWKREYIGRVYPRQGVADIESLKKLVDS